MIMLSKREKETLREISQWKQFYANWKPKTRAKLERMNLVANDVWRTINSLKKDTHCYSN